MHLSLVLVSGIIAAFASVLQAQPESVVVSGDLTKAAKEFVESLAKEDFAGATSSFDSTMKAAMPAEKLANTWETILSQVGALRKQKETRTEKMGPYEIVYVTCEFEKMLLDAKVVYNGAGQIAGLYFAPAQAKVEYETPSYADTLAFKETEMQVGEGRWALPGTLTLPAGNGPFPALILVHGSGPQDRDESIGPNKPFRDLAWGLATRGVAVLRYEKRTKTHAAELFSMKDSITVKEETTDDAISALAALRREKKVDSRRIFVLGHSLGGMLIPRIGSADSDIAGFIILAGMAKPLEEAILSQFTYIFSLDSVVTDDEKSQLENIERQVARVKDPTLSAAVPPNELPLGLPASYWLDLRGYDPAKTTAELRQPMLIMQGGRDYQVTSEDFQAWQNALFSRKNMEFKFYPELNHLFVRGEGRITPDEYERPGHVDKAAIDDIAGWIGKQ